MSKIRINAMIEIEINKALSGDVSKLHLKSQRNKVKFRINHAISALIFMIFGLWNFISISINSNDFPLIMEVIFAITFCALWLLVVSWIYFRLYSIIIYDIHFGRVGEKVQIYESRNIQKSIDIIGYSVLMFAAISLLLIF